jgi:hypothetical protein
MKVKLCRSLRPVSILLLLILFISVVMTPTYAIEVSSAAKHLVTKSVSSGASVSFSASDFSQSVPDLIKISLSSLPVKSVGVLSIEGEAAEIGDALRAEELESLTFSAGPKAGATTYFEVSATALDGSERTVAVVVRVNAGANHPPIAENIDLTTYKGVASNGVFRAVDPEGDLVTFSIESAPRKGTVEIAGNSFTYTPAQGKSGRDSFTYVATDANGNVSGVAKVQILINKQKTEVSYSDMEGNSAHYAALRLAETDVFVGEKLGTSYFFYPDRPVTRGEFLAMCLRACGMDAIKDITRTGFADDADMPLWVKPYVSAALLSGVIKGYQTDSGSLVFSAASPVSYAEAAVILNNLLEITDVSRDIASASADLVPSWAYQATANLASCDIVPTNSSVIAGGNLTRADIAEMLSASMNLIEQRGGNSLLSWARK